MQKKFGIVVIAAIQGSGLKQHGRPGVSKASRRRPVTVQASQVGKAA